MAAKRATRESEHEFTLVLTGVTPETPGVEDALFEAGCDDATLAFRMGRPVLTFARTAKSLKEAILSAIHNVRSAGVGLDVLRVDYCNLVTQAEIARRLGRSRQQVQQYMSGARGPGGFPGPQCELSEGSWLWAWCEVASWACEHDMLDAGALRDVEEVDAINSVLSIDHKRKLTPALVDEIIRAFNVKCSP